MDSTDKLINAAVSQYAPSENVKKVYLKNHEKVSGVKATNSDISIVYVSKDAKKLLNKIFQRTSEYSGNFLKLKMKFFRKSAHTII